LGASPKQVSAVVNTVPDVGALLQEQLEGYDGGPSSGGISWHDISYYERCPRFAYWSMIRGLRSRTRAKPLEYGTLLHACFEQHYKTGGRSTFAPIDIVAAAGHEAFAYEVKKAVYGYLRKYGQEEADTWDVRGVEAQAHFFMDEQSIHGKRVKIPITCRHDLLVGIREPGGPYTPPGQIVKNGCYIADFKSAKGISSALVESYGMDGQLLMNALIYTVAEAKVHGPLAGVFVPLLAKHVNPDETSFQRVQGTIAYEVLNDFYSNEVKHEATELYTMLTSPDAQDVHAWRTRRSSCFKGYGTCRYFALCDAGSGAEGILDAFYQVCEDRIKRPENFLLPEKAPKQPQNSTQAASQGIVVTESKTVVDEEKAAKLAERNIHKDLSVRTLMSALAAEYVQPQQFIAPGDKRAAVKSKLIHYLGGMWPKDSEFDLPTGDEVPDIGHIFYTVTDKGIKWNTMKLKGSVAWSTIADLFCRNWWDPQKNKPMGV
jgi:hypothetical protein